MLYRRVGIFDFYITGRFFEGPRSDAGRLELAKCVSK